VIEHVATRIQEIRQGGVPPIPPQEPNLNQAMPSSNIGPWLRRKERALTCSISWQAS